MSEAPSAKVYAGCLVAIFALVPASSTALASEQGAASWIGVNVRVPFAERYSFQLTTEPRLFENPNQLRILLVRPWFDMRLPHGFGVALGYDALVFFKASDRREHRIWQQVSHGHGWEHVRSLARFRLEQRFFSDMKRASVRARFMVGLAVRLGLDIDLVVKNEFFVNFNEVPVVGKQGYAENRLYGGFGRRFAPWVQASIGYQMQWLNLEVVDLINHTVIVGVAFETPSLGRRRTTAKRPRVTGSI